MKNSKSENGISDKGTLGKGDKGTLGAPKQIVPLLALLSFSTPLFFSIAEINVAATTNPLNIGTHSTHCDVHPLTVTLLQALSATSNSSLTTATHATLESCSFIHDAARAGKVSGVFFHTDLTSGGFDFVPPTYREAQNILIKDSERLAFESERDSFQSLKAAWVEELASQSATPTAIHARKLWLTKYQHQLSEGSQSTVLKIAKIWVKSAQSSRDHDQARTRAVTKL